MALSTTFRSKGQRHVNPRLGIYFSIFSAAYVGLVITLLVLEQLGYSDTLVKSIMVAAPAAFAAVIGIASFSGLPDDFFVSGRRVPAFFNGMIVGVTAIGATGILGLTGTFYLYGSDALCIAAGYFAGILLAGVMLVPFLRKLGAYTIPSYLGRRFESRSVRMTSALLLSVPVVLILVAELRVGAALVKSVAGVNRGSFIWPAAIALCITVLPGGMRSLSWSNAAWALIAFMALLVPVCTLSLSFTNLPVPQLTYGSLLPELTKLEAGAGLTPKLAPAFAFDLPSFGVSPLLIPFTNSFGMIGATGFLLAAITVMLGTAGMPSVLVRSATTPGVFEARKTMAWAAVIIGVILLTLPAIAVLTRMMVLTDLVGKSPDRLPAWFLAFVQSDQATLELQTATVGVNGIGFRRDTILFAMPLLAGFPAVMTYVAVSGIVAAALAGASARMVVLANMVSEDLFFGTRKSSPEPKTRLLLARIALVMSAMIGAWVALQWTVDPLKLVLWSMSLTASTGLPVLIMSVWWKRVTKAGALFGMLAGFVVSGACIITDATLPGSTWLGVDSTLAAVFGLPAAVLVAVIASLLSPKPAPEVSEFVRDIRMPGGETIHDRETRLARAPAALQTASAGRQ